MTREDLELKIEDLKRQLEAERSARVAATTDVDQPAKRAGLALDVAEAEAVKRAGNAYARARELDERNRKISLNRLRRAQKAESEAERWRLAGDTWRKRYEDAIRRIANLEAKYKHEL